MDWLKRMMIDRNGPDTLSNYTLGIGFVCSIISSVFRIRFLNILAAILLLITLFRVLSKNVYARKQENIMFLQLLYKLKAPFRNIKRHSEQKSIYKFYKCPSCKQRSTSIREHEQIKRI